MKLISLFLIFTILCSSAAPFGLPHGPAPSLLSPPLEDSCSIAPNSALKKEVVEGVCKMANTWQKSLNNVSPTTVPQYRTILTPDQKKYWDSVCGCKKIECVSDYWSQSSSSSSTSSSSTSSKTEVKSEKSEQHQQQHQQSKNETKSKNQQRYGKSTRKEIRTMTETERRTFFSALKKLKRDKIDGWSKYDILTGYHYFVPFTPAAHFSAGLLPFHREFLKTLEVALRLEHPFASFPYWDSSLDSELPNPKDTVLFTDELCGSGDGSVSGGAFGSFTGGANPNFPIPLYTGGITRAFGAAQSGVLFTKEYLDIISAKPTVHDLVFCKDPFFDIIHCGVHLYVGGLMANPATALNDPLFFLHHCFIDYIWEQWRQKHQDRKQRESVYALPCNPFDLPDMQLFPFVPKVKDGYSNSYTDDCYTYQEPYTCENECHDSEYLVCNSKRSRCMSKIRVGGDCSGLEGVDACYKSKCQGGKCVAS